MLPMFLPAIHKIRSVTRSKSDQRFDHVPCQQASAQIQTFARGEWGGEWFPEFALQAGDVVVKAHRGSSGFANTDLDLLLKQKNITHLIFIGLIANTCIETTAKFASELGYHVTLGLSCGLHRIERLDAPNALKARPRRRKLPSDTGLRVIDMIAPNILDRRDFVIYAAGLMLKELIAASPLRVVEGKEQGFLSCRSRSIIG
jgi:Isochorismatase family